MGRDFAEYQVSIVPYVFHNGPAVIYAARPVIRIKNLVERWPSTVRPSGEMGIVRAPARYYA